MIIIEQLINSTNRPLNLISLENTKKVITIVKKDIIDKSYKPFNKLIYKNFRILH